LPIKSRSKFVSCERLQRIDVRILLQNSSQVQIFEQQYLERGGLTPLCYRLDRTIVPYKHPSDLIETLQEAEARGQEGGLPRWSLENLKQRAQAPFPTLRYF
jgi:hypothetical protein